MSLSKYASALSSNFRQVFVAGCLMSLLWSSSACGGGSSVSSNPNPTPVPGENASSAQIKMGDAPADRVTSFEITVGPITMTPSTGSVITVLSGTRRFSPGHSDDLFQLGNTIFEQCGYMSSHCLRCR
jgi:hypothetical protein